MTPTAGSSGAEVFRNYYKTQHNTVFDKETSKNLVEVVKKTFESLGAKDVKELKIDNKTVLLKDLDSSDMKIFARFIKGFFKNNPLPEKEALELYEKMTLAENNETLNSNVRFFIQRDPIQSTKNHILLLSTLDSTDLNPSDPVSKEAIHRISELLKIEQKKGLDLEDQIKNAKTKLKITNSVLATGFVVGTGMLFASGILVVGFLPAALPFFVVGAVLMSFTVARFFNDPTASQTEEDTRGLEQTVLRFEELESYKKLVEGEKYVAFTKDPKNEYSRFINNNESFSQFLDLFAREDKHEKLLEKQQTLIEAEKKDEDVKFLQEKIQIAKDIEKSNRQIKAQRAEMGLG